MPYETHNECRPYSKRPVSQTKKGCDPVRSLYGEITESLSKPTDLTDPMFSVIKDIQSRVLSKKRT